MTVLARVETKVWAALTGVLSGGAFGSLAVWALGVWIWHAPDTASGADAAIAAVPWPVSEFLPVLLAAILGGALAFRAPASNHAGNATGVPMDDTAAGHAADEPAQTDSHVSGHLIADAPLDPDVAAG